MPSDVPQHILDALDKAETYLCGIKNSPAERVEGANAVFTAAQGNAIALAEHKFGARMLEEALQIGTREQIISVFSELYPVLLTIIYMESGSHVCQTLLAIVSRIYRDEHSNIVMNTADASAINKQDGNLGELYSALILQKIIPAMPSLVTNKFSNHVLRTLLRVEAGQPPEDEVRGRRKHANESTFCTMYELTDPFAGVCSNLFAPFVQALYKAIQGKGTIYHSCFDTYNSVLLQLYCQMLARCKNAVDVPSSQQPLGVLLQLLNLPLKIIDKVTHSKLKDFTLKFTTFRDLCKNTSACFALESIFESVFITNPSSCGALASFVLRGTILSRSDNEFKSLATIAGSKTASHVFAKIIGYCDDYLLFTELLGIYTESCAAIFEHDYSKLIQSLFKGLCKANSIVLKKPLSAEGADTEAQKTTGSSEVVSTDQSISAFIEAQKIFANVIIELTGAKKAFVRALLLPGQPITGPFNLEFSFTTNGKYIFKTLNTTLDDKAEVTPEFKRQRREEHQRRKSLEREQAFGTKYKKKESGVVTLTGIWQTGKGIVISWFNMGNPEVVNLAAESLVDHAFPTPGDAFKIIMHPAGCDVYQALLGSTYVAPWFKIKLINNLKPVINKLASNKLGCLVIKSLFDASLGDPGDIPEDVVEASRIVLAGEIDFHSISSSFHGKQLCLYMKLDEFQVSSDDWSRSLQRRTDVRREIMSIFDEADEPRRRKKT